MSNDAFTDVKSVQSYGETWVYFMVSILHAEASSLFLFSQFRSTFFFYRVLFSLYMRTHLLLLAVDDVDN